MSIYLKLANNLDDIANRLEAAGLIKEATELDVISNTLEAFRVGEPVDLNYKLPKDAPEPLVKGDVQPEHKPNEQDLEFDMKAKEIKATLFHMGVKPRTWANLSISDKTELINILRQPEFHAELMTLGDYLPSQKDVPITNDPSLKEAIRIIRKVPGLNLIAQDIEDYMSDKTNAEAAPIFKRFEDAYGRIKSLEREYRNKAFQKQDFRSGEPWDVTYDRAQQTVRQQIAQPPIGTPRKITY